MNQEIHVETESKINVDFEVEYTKMGGGFVLCYCKEFKLGATGKNRADAKEMFKTVLKKKLIKYKHAI